MKICPNLSNPQVKEDFETLVTIFGENEAYYLWDKNGGYFLDRTSEGDLNTIYTTAYENYNNKEFSIAKSCIFRYNKKGCCRNRQQIMNRT